MKTIWDVIKGPVITEKALTMKEELESMGREGNDRQLLTLKVDRHASKPQIKAAVEKIFGVKVADVRVANYQGKIKRTPRQREGGRRPAWKKAYVTLKSNEKTIVYEDAI
jgi:large subunit ribosomal protein L23